MTGRTTRGHPQIHMSEQIQGQELAPTAPVRPEAPTFAELGARQETVEALAAAGITRAFAIQEYALPIGLRGVDLIGPGRAGVFTNLVPVFSAILAVVLIAEPFAPFHAVALALVIGGIWLAQRTA